MNSRDIKYATGGFIRDFKQFLLRRKSAKLQRTYCWCPICDEDLCSNESFVSDTDLVRYECTNCGCRSAWDFDAPCPLLIRNDSIIYDKDI